MKERILTGWTIPRALYLIIGIIIVIQSAMENEWIGIVFGGFFASMGLFAFGCASGNCYVPQSKKTNEETSEVNLENTKIK